MDKRGVVEGIPAPGREARFGSFALNLQTGELRKHGVRVRLQGKPFQILRALLERPGRVVTREELRNRLWASDSLADFESRLNTAMNRLRITLGDSAENPIYVETISRLGYRFVAPIERIQEQAAGIDEHAGEPTQGESAVTPETELGDFPLGRMRKAARKYWAPALVLALGAALAIVAFQAHRSSERPVSFRQLTFQKGFATGARFTPDGKDIVYSAGWNGGATHLYLTGAAESGGRELSGEARIAGFPSSQEIGFFTMSGKPPKWLLEAEAYDGGAPHIVSERAKDADWSRNGRLAVITADASYYSIEYPAGQIIYRSDARLDDLRVSPGGERVAFVEHPVPGDDAGRVMTVDASSREARVLSSGWGSVDGLAWNPSGREVWFTAAASGVERALNAVSLSGTVRKVAQMPGGMELRDIDSAGNVLIDRSTQHMSMMLGNFEKETQQDISWLDWSRAVAMSEDGKSVLFDESGSGGGAGYSVFIEHTGSDTPKRIGEGRAMDMSSDGRWVLAQDAHDETKLMLISADGSTHQPVQGGGITYRWVRFLPGAQSILLSGAYPNQPPRLYKQQLPDGLVVPTFPEAAPDSFVISPDGKMAAAFEPTNRIVLFDLVRSRKRVLQVVKPIYPVAFNRSGELLTSRMQDRSIVLELLNPRNGQVAPYRRIEMPEAPGIVENLPVCVSGDFRSYVYSRLQSLSTLFAVSGWK